MDIQQSLHTMSNGTEAQMARLGTI